MNIEDNLPNHTYKHLKFKLKLKNILQERFSANPYSTKV